MTLFSLFVLRLNLGLDFSHESIRTMSIDFYIINILGDKLDGLPNNIELIIPYPRS